MIKTHQTYPQKIAARAANKEEYIRELESLLDREQKRLAEIEASLPDCPQCSIEGCSPVEHALGDVGYCDDCGSVYYVHAPNGFDITVWIDPNKEPHRQEEFLNPRGFIFKDESLLSIWNNDAAKAEASR